MLQEIPRGVEVLVKKAAVDPAFMKTLIAKRGRAADDIALKLSPAEEAMLAAVPEAQLRAIVANTKVSPGLRPAFLGATAAAMLAALGTAAYAEDPDEWEMRTTGIDAEMPPKAETADATPDNVATNEYATLSGSITDEKGLPIGGVLVVVKGTNRFSTSDGNGYYEITRLPEGSFEVSASRVSYDPEIVEAVKFIKGYRTNLSFVLKSNPKSEGFTDEPVIKGIRPDQP